MHISKKELWDSIKKWVNGIMWSVFTLLEGRNRSRKENGFERELTACCRAGLKGDGAYTAIDGDHNQFFSYF